MKKKSSVIFFFCLLVTLLISGCSGKQKPLRILVDIEGAYTTYPDLNQNASCGDFLADNVKLLGGPEDIEIEVIPAEGAERDVALTRVRTEVMAGGGPDVFIVSSATAPNPEKMQAELKSLFLMPEKTKELGLFYPLDEYIENAQYMEWDKLTPAVMAAGRSEKYGQVLLPLVYDFNTAFFLKDDISYTPTAAGNWEDVLNDETGILKSVMPCGQFTSSSDMLGVLADYTKNELLFTEEELYQRIDESVEMLHQDEASTDLPKHYLTTYSAGWDKSDNIESTDFGIVFASELEECQEQKKQLPIKAIPTYSDDGGAVATVRAFAAINGNTKRPDDAFLVLDYLLSKEGQSTSLIYHRLSDTGVPTYEGLMTEENPVVLSNGVKWSMSDENYEAFCQARDCITHVKFLGTIEMELDRLWSNFEKAKRLGEDVDLKEMVHEAYSRMAIEIGE